MATIKDVAAMAGVSISTVSYALNGNRSISERKKLVIKEAAQKLGYRPRAIARSLASGRTHIIAILFPPVDHGIGLPEIDLIMEASRNVMSRAYHLVIWTLRTTDPDELVQLISQELVDGVIMMEVHRKDSRIAALREAGIPFILLGRDDTAPAETYVDIDFFTTIMQCLVWLKNLGHRRIVFINQSKKSFRNGYGPVVRAHESFTELCHSLEIDGKEYFCESSGETVLGRMKEIFTACPGVTAFVVMNDRALPGIISGITQQGLSIPADVSVVSIVSSAAAASYMVPKLSLFEMDIGRLVEAAVSQLIAKIEGHYVEIQERLIPCILREYQSTGPAKNGA
ncbi:MAG: LacI family transcriptional regulator [Treponema sp.]|jgi:DNA-binding LacI/PurR family transcriptional regulator|nr:LacI family transcriptional regulator [Treponema sp.]